MKVKMFPLMVYIDAPLHFELTEYKIKSGCSIRFIVSQALQEYLTKKNVGRDNANKNK